MAESDTSAASRGLQHGSSVLLGAVAVAAVAAWAAAEVADPLIVFLGVSVMAGYLLDRRAGDRRKLVLVGYAVAGVVLVSPVLYLLPEVLAGRTSVLGQTMTVVLTRLFVLVAGVVAYGTYLLDGGAGIRAGLRDSGRRRAVAGYLVGVGLIVAPVLLFVLDLAVGTDLLPRVGALGWRLLGGLGLAVAAAARRDSGRAGAG